MEIESDNNHERQRLKLKIKIWKINYGKCGRWEKLIKERSSDGREGERIKECNKMESLIVKGNGEIAIDKVNEMESAKKK